MNQPEATTISGIDAPMCQDAGKREVQKSACVFCPFKSNAEWRRLRDTDAEGWNRAVQIDTALRLPGNVVNRNMDQKPYVHARLRSA